MSAIAINCTDVGSLAAMVEETARDLDPDWVLSAACAGMSTRFVSAGQAPDSSNARNCSATRAAGCGKRRHGPHRTTKARQTQSPPLTRRAFFATGHLSVPDGISSILILRRRKRAVSKDGDGPRGRLTTHRRAASPSRRALRAPSG